MVTVISVPRKEVGLARRIDGNLLIYGRRKVGKTYLIKNYLDYTVYMTVKRGGGIHIEGMPLKELDDYNQFKDILTGLIGEGKTVVIDEFQRLPDEFLDFLSILDEGGRLILSGSSFHLVKRVFTPKSPVLGMFSEMKLSLISPSDIYLALSAHTDPLKAYELSPYLRDPWSIRYFKGKETKVEDIVYFSRNAVRALVGEAFLEEDRNLSAVYEAVIRQLSRGKWKLKEIADVLHGRGMIPRSDASLIRPYIRNMEEMDIIGRQRIHGKNEFRYMLRSPIMELSFYLDEKIDFFDGETDIKQVEKVIRERIPRHIEVFTGHLMAELYGGRFEYFYTSDFDIDFIITRGSGVVACGEVKWKEDVEKSDIERFKERTRHLGGKKIIFSKNEIEVPGVVSITPENLREILGHGWNPEERREPMRI